MGLGDKTNEGMTQDIILGKTKYFQIDMEFKGARGTFKFRRPSLKDRLTMGVVEANFIGGTNRNAVAIETLNIARAMSVFTTVMESSPDWFDVDTFDDYEFMVALYDKYFEVTNPFRGVGKKNPEDQEVREK